MLLRSKKSMKDNYGQHRQNYYPHYYHNCKGNQTMTIIPKIKAILEVAEVVIKNIKTTLDEVHEHISKKNEAKQ